jgi:Protein of unknown function (DUF3102)
MSRLEQTSGESKPAEAANTISAPEFRAPHEIIVGGQADAAHGRGRLMLPAPAIPFNYDTLPAATAASLRKQAARIREGVKTTTAAIIEVGRDLIAAKQDLEHSQFCEWVEAECVFSMRSAQNYMRAAEFAEGKNATIAFLQPATVYKLSAKSAPPEVVQEVIDRAAKGKVISDRDVIAALKEANFEKREAKAKQRLATRRDVSKRTLAKNEARRLANEDVKRKEDERLQRAVLAIIDTIGEGHVHFLLDVLKPMDAWQILDRLRVEVAKLDGDTAADAPKSLGGRAPPPKIASLAVPPVSAPTKLVWEEKEGVNLDGQVRSDFSLKVGHGEYRITPSFNAFNNMRFAGYCVDHLLDRKKLSIKDNRRSIDGSFRTSDAAKAAAQRDYERLKVKTKHQIEAEAEAGAEAKKTEQDAARDIPNFLRRDHPECVVKDAAK